MNVLSYNETLVAAYDARIAYETAKNAENTSIQKTLKDLRASVSHARIAEIMNACDVDANHINRSERVNARMNVYAAEKVVNISRFLACVASLNHYTLAIVKTAFALEQASLQMTHKDAQSACSLDVKLSDKTREALIVKYQKFVNASTVTTQSSSSINALQMYHILIESKNAANETVYTLNHENAVTLDLLVSLDCLTND